MYRENQISGLHKLSLYIKKFLESNSGNSHENDEEFNGVLRKSEIENPWFTIENQKFALKQWADLLTTENIRKWLFQL